MEEITGVKFNVIVVCQKRELKNTMSAGGRKTAVMCEESSKFG